MKSILGKLALIITLISITSWSYASVMVTLDDTKYNITTMEGSAIELLPQLMDQDWWGDIVLAQELALVLEGDLGFPNSPGTPSGPAFAVAINLESSTVFTRVCYQQLLPNCVGGFNPSATAPTVFAKATVVPLPAAAWLFGSALLGLIGYSRRKTRV